MRRAVGMAGKGWTAGTQPAEQALQANTAGGLSARLRPQNKRPQMAGLAAITTAADQRRPASRRAVQIGGGSAKMLALRKAGADLPNLSLPHLSPLPVTVPTHSLNLAKPNLAPNYLFFFRFYFI